MSDRAGVPRGGDATEANAGACRRGDSLHYGERNEATA